VKKNVLQFVGSFHQGGSERQAVQLTRLLRENAGHNIFIATLNGEGVLRAEVEALGFKEIPEYKLTSFYDLNFLKQLRKCAEYLRGNKIEIIQTHDFYTNVFGIAAATLARVPVKIASKRETGGMRSRLQRILEKQAFRQVQAIVVNSAAVKDYLIGEGIAAEKLNVVYNGLDLERLQPKIKDRREICEKLGLPGDENIKFITLVANLRHRVKNQAMFLRAVEKVRREFPDAHYVVAGEGELRGELESLAKQLGVAENVHFIGRCEIVPELLSVSYAGVLCSFHEGFSNSILEYMAAAKPVVATDVGGAREALSEGVNGFLVASDDDAALAERLIDLLKNAEKARAFGAAGRRSVEEKFSVAAQLAQTIDLYERLSNEG
jgi:glycosyltransferase involved in cell wall biosynthesis